MINKYKMIAAMLIFGTLGIFVNFIPLPSSLIALSRSLLGTLFMGVLFLFGKTKISLKKIKKNALLLLASGFALGFNWILLFESYFILQKNVIAWHLCLTTTLYIIRFQKRSLVGRL